MQGFANDLEGRFLDRPNRFLVRVETDAGPVEAHCPNPGRMLELLTPGQRLVLERSPQGGRRTSYTLAAAYHAGEVVPLHAARANRIAEELILPRLFPTLRSLRREVAHGSSRLDFLLELPDRRILLEVKACTLVEHGVAMFPDAPTERGRRHLEELAAASRDGRGEAHVLFLILHSDARVLIPCIHTDPAFAVALADAGPHLHLHAASVRAEASGRLHLRRLEVPLDLAPVRWAREDRGCYLLLVPWPERRVLSIGALGRRELPPGTYVYVGSARRNLTRRVARHLRRRKRIHWHVDHLLRAAPRPRALPIRTGLDLECRLARDLAVLAEEAVPGFGSSDCGCSSHLLRFPGDPRKDPAFLELLLRYRHRIALMDSPPARG